MFRKFLVFCGFLFTLSSQSGFATVTMTDTKALLQRGNYSKLTITFTLKNISTTENTNFGLSKFTPDEGALMLTRYLDICIGSQTGQKCVAGLTPLKVPYTNNPTVDTTPLEQRRNDLTAAFPSGPNFVEETLDSGTTTTAIYRRLEVVIEITGPANVFSTNTIVNLRLLPGTSTSTTDYAEDEEAAKLAVATNAVVTSLEVRPSKGTLTAIWNKEEAIGRTDATSSVSDGALAFTVEESRWAEDIIPLHTYKEASPDAEETIPNACHIVASTDATSCELECGGINDEDGLHYLKPSDLSSFNLTSVGNTGSLSITGLTAGTRYALVFQNQPDGLKRKCLIGTPSDAITLVQLGGGPEPKVKDPRCFIATAAYGSSMDHHLDTLRWFRDNVLMVTKVGHQFVQTYYRYSPPVANFISEHPSLRAVTRGALWLPVILIEFWRERPSLLLTLSAMSGTFLLLFLRRRSLRASV